MKLWDAIKNAVSPEKPALKRPRVYAVLRSRIPKPSKRQKEVNLARDVLAMNRHMRQQQMPYRLRLRKVTDGELPEIVLIDALTGSPVTDLVYSNLCDLALLPKD